MAMAKLLVTYIVLNVLHICEYHVSELSYQLNTMSLKVRCPHHHHHMEKTDAGLTGLCIREIILSYDFINTQTRMWANPQRDGRPAEYRWRPLFNTAKFG